MPTFRHPVSRGPRQLAAALAAAATALGALAQGLPTAPNGPLSTPQNVVSLNASASAEVQKDWITVVFSTARDGADAATVQSRLRQALDAALQEARKIARPGQVEVQTGAFSVYPRYASKANAAPSISGWQGSTELVVEGRDVQAITQLTGRVSTLGIARVGFSLSREAREKVEADVSAQAIANFRARAEAVSRHFGFTGYTVREVAVNADSAPLAPMPVMRAQALKSVAEEALPVEAGMASVTVQVSGSVQMR